MKALKVDIVSLFPNFFTTPLQESLISKAIQRKILQVEVHNLRSFSHLSHQSVDDTPYGGGAGMVLRVDVLSEAVKKLKTKDSLVILLDPSGKKFDQKLASNLSTKNHLILVCGRYEGVDQRFKDKYVDLEVSLGDYVLNGGEAAALVLLESVGRLVPGVIGSEESLHSESFSIENQGILEYPQYTRPEIFENLSVPKILTSGNHQKISVWRKEQALKKTKKLRPDLLK